MAGKRLCFLATIGNSYRILDSGASDHITHDLSLLHDVKPIQQNCFITMPNGEKARILHVGSMALGHDIILKDVLYTPAFRFNLLSISRLTKQLSANVLFTPECCILQDQAMRKEIILGKENKGLYCMNKGGQPLQSKEEQCSNQSQLLKTNKRSLRNITGCFSDSELWHFRYGHLPFEQLQYLDIPQCNKSKSSVCQICPMAKFNRSSFPLSNTKATVCFELLHIDIWVLILTRPTMGSSIF